MDDPRGQVWVIVRPTETGDFWVQPFVTVKDEMTLEIDIHIGRPGSQDAGKRFEILAVVDPKLRLKNGDRLDRWPEAKARSRVIEVTRR